ncbi:hypothetical protein TcWFU_005302 [Taenia crassiceps]|uniref:Uncharacterized protein n=1 Tax=Taenia crassiceps TaxID=6207 RepID=A0ABR4QGW6_9CEST
MLHTGHFGSSSPFFTLSCCGSLRVLDVYKFEHISVELQGSLRAPQNAILMYCVKINLLKRMVSPFNCKTSDILKRHGVVLITRPFYVHDLHFLMGNSALASKFQHSRQFEDAAVQGNPLIRCEHVRDPCRKVGHADGKSRRSYEHKISDSNRLSLENLARKSLPSVKEQTSHRQEPQFEKDVSTMPVDSISTITVDQPHPIPVITVTRFNDQEKAKTTPKVHDCLPEVIKTSQAVHVRNQPGLTGVPRHKPIQRLSQTSPTKAISRSPRRTNSVTPRPERSQLTKCKSVVRPPRPERALLKPLPHVTSNSSIRNRETKISQNRMHHREYGRLASPTNCKRSNSAGPYLRHPTPINTPRRAVSRDVSKRAPGLPQSRLEYTFYIRDTDEHRRPFDENTADAIARSCQCSIELITLGKGFPPIIHKGVRVCPVTITTSNMTNLRRCLAKFDAHYPEFNAKAFLPH